MTLRLLQHRSDEGERSVIAARGGDAVHLVGAQSTRALAEAAIARGMGLAALLEGWPTGRQVDLAAEYAAGRLLAPIDHDDPAHLLISGTGLTHLGSAEQRDKMHRDASASAVKTDSMRMFLEGVEGGKPAAGQTGQQPTGRVLGGQIDLPTRRPALEQGAEAHAAGDRRFRQRPGRLGAYQMHGVAAPRGDHRSLALVAPVLQEAQCHGCPAPEITAAARRRRRRRPAGPGGFGRLRRR